MYSDSIDRIDGQQVTPGDIMEWFPQLEHREACRLLWAWKARSNGRQSDVSRSDLEGLLGDIEID